LTFEQLEDLFYDTKISASPSGFHGFLSGRLSCGAVSIDLLVDASAEWLGLSGEQADAIATDLTEFYQASLNDLEDLSFLFSPLLPDDEFPLSERLAAVGEWCSNYLSGLAEGMEDDLAISEDGKEALGDLGAIAQISIDFENDDDGERDYTELVEYVRLAVQVIFTDLHPELDPQNNPTIH
jgi:uncharacterized protein YgfB (UPF0149 family)